MAGRAGRRGKDTRGYVIHLPSLYHNLDSIGWRETMKATPQTIESKFDYHYGLILQAYRDKTVNLEAISAMSLACQEIQKTLQGLRQQWDGKDYSAFNVFFEIDRLNSKFANKNGVLVYKDRKQQAKDKKRKIALIADTENFHLLREEYLKNKEKITQQMDLSKQFQQYSMLMQNNCSAKIKFLQQIGYLDETLNITESGDIATCFNEINPIIGTTIVKYKMWDEMNKEHLVKFLGSIGDAKYEVDIQNTIDLKPLLHKMDQYSMKEQRLGVTPISDWNTNSMIGPLMWEILSGENSISAVSFNYGIEEGNLLKHLWKFENVCNEFAQACKKTGDDQIMVQLQEISQMIQNMYAPSDSIYIKLSNVSPSADSQPSMEDKED